MSSIVADSLSYAELKETVKQMLQQQLPVIYLPKGLHVDVLTRMIMEQERNRHVVNPMEYIEARLPVTNNLALAEKLEAMISRIPVSSDVDTNDLPKPRYHNRTFPKNFWKKKKAKRRNAKQSRKHKSS